ncbi:MAG: hypothetical protein AABW59_04800 [archaeon]
MIFVYLIVFIVALVLANIFVAVAVPKSNSYTPKEEKQGLEPEVVEVINAIDERHAITKGSLEATNRKLMVMNDRVNTMEKALSEVIKKKMEIAEDARQKEDVDMEKIDFRLKVLEQQIENLKHPKQHTHSNTFYGKVDPELEKEVKALAFNTKRN